PHARPSPVDDTRSGARTGPSVLASWLHANARDRRTPARRAGSAASGGGEPLTARLADVGRRAARSSASARNAYGCAPGAPLARSAAMSIVRMSWIALLVVPGLAGC